MGSKNGYFQLDIRGDGLWIKLFPAEKGASPVRIEEISAYLGEKKIGEYDIKELNRIINKGIEEETSMKLNGGTILVPDELCKIRVSEDKMIAIARFYPEGTGGGRLSKEDIKSKLLNNGVKFGIMEDALDNYIKNRNYCEDIVVAKGKAPRDGCDAIITYKFNTDKSVKPKMNEDGTVDFHQLDLINHVNKGDLLAELTPADLGDVGTNVQGVDAKPKKVNKAVLKHGKNIHLSEDGCKMYSDVSGHVSLEGDKVFVSNTYEVPADVDTSTGDITYDGNVNVKGNVRTGFSISAKGDIVIDGVVEGATLYAEGKIILKRGIQGMNRGVLEAKGNIVAKFIESSTVRSGGSITTEAIMHSKVAAKEEILVNGKKGFITGGEIRSGTIIRAKTAGSPMGTQTVLEVGIDPTVTDECRRLEKSLIDMREEKEKISKIVELLVKKVSQGDKLTPEKQKQLQNAHRRNIELATQLKEDALLYEQLQMELEGKTDGRIKIERVAYPGVKIVISNVVYFVRNDIKFSQFYRDRADIKIMGY